jgi:hypothetical protein
MSFFSFDLPNDLPPQDMSQFLADDGPEFVHSTSAVQSPPPSPSGVKKTKWTPEEDNLLSESVHEHGMANWTLIAQSVPGRNGKQCRERWTNQLCPSLNKENWTHQEDITLLQQQRIYGNVWSQVARYLPGRSANSVKNRWSWLSRHRLPPSAPQMPLPYGMMPPPIMAYNDQTAPPDLLWGMHPPPLIRQPPARVVFSDPPAAPPFSFSASPPAPAPLREASFQTANFLVFDEDPHHHSDGMREASPFAQPDRDLDDESYTRFDEWSRF